MMNLLKLAAAIATLLPTSCPVSAAVTHDEQIILQPDVHATTSPHAINVAIIGTPHRTHSGIAMAALTP
jgi:hypothetical protein